MLNTVSTSGTDTSFTIGTQKCHKCTPNIAKILYWQSGA